MELPVITIEAPDRVGGCIFRDTVARRVELPGGNAELMIHVSSCQSARFERNVTGVLTRLLNETTDPEQLRLRLQAWIDQYSPCDHVFVPDDVPVLSGTAAQRTRCPSFADWILRALF